MGRHPVDPMTLEQIARYSDDHTWDETAHHFKCAKTTVQHARLEYPKEEPITHSVGMIQALRENLRIIRANKNFKNSVPKQIKDILDLMEDLICQL